MEAVVEKNGRFMGCLTPNTPGVKGEMFFGPDKDYLDQEDNLNGYLVAKALQVLEELGLPVRYDSHLDVSGSNGHITEIHLDYQEIDF